MQTAKKPSLARMVFEAQLLIDYNLGLKKRIEAGKYDEIDDASLFTAKNFPKRSFGKTTRIVKVINFRIDISGYEVLERFAHWKLRPAQIWELLAIGEKFPDLQRKFVLPALGSMIQAPYGFRRIPGISGLEDCRHLGWDWFDKGPFEDFYAFAAVL